MNLIVLGFSLLLLLMSTAQTAPPAGTGAIYGRITDGRGEPAGAVEVQALTVSYEDGQRKLTLSQSARTNDLGEYRMFWLPRGLYVVSAIPNYNTAMRIVSALDSSDAEDSSMRRTRPALTVPGRVNPRLFAPDTLLTGLQETFYFRGADNPDAATLVLLGSGTEVAADIAMVPGQRRRVRGEIVNGVTGGVFNSSRIRVNTGTTLPDGAWAGVLPPGSHLIFATAVHGDTEMMGRTRVDVGQSDVMNVRLTLMPAIRIDGRVVFEGQPAGVHPEVRNLRVKLRVQPGNAVMPNPEAAPSADGTFVLDKVISGVDYDAAVFVPASLGNAYVKSIRLGATDILDRVYHAEGQPGVPMEIVLGVDGGTLDGAALTPGVTVVLAPNGDRRRRADLYKVALTDASGRFHIAGIAPGNYEIFAWEDVPNGAWQDPDFMRLYEGQGTPVHMEERASLSVVVELIRSAQ